MTELRVGIVGYGWVSGAHIEAINSLPLARVVAVCSSRPQDPAALSSRHGTRIECYGSLDDMLAKGGVDVVSICSFHYLHAEQAIAAARAGKHIIIEKPLALTLEDCRKIQQVVDETGVGTCVCFECRYSGQFIATRSVIEQGLIGRVHYGEVDYYHGIGPRYTQYKWNTKKELAGSSLLTAGCHALDALLLCMGDDVVEVSGYSTSTTSSQFSDYEYDTTSVALLKYGDGRVAKVTSCIDCVQPYYFHVHLVGSEGSLLDNRFYSTKIAGLNKSAWSQLSMSMLDSGDVSDHPYAAQFSAFFESLREKKPMPLTSLKEALRTHEILFAIEESIRTGKSVNVAEFLKAARAR